MSLSFTPNEENKFRTTTKTDTLHGITLNRQKCSKCKQAKPLAGGKRIKGYSRHEPGKFYCKECYETHQKPA